MSLGESIEQKSTVKLSVYVESSCVFTTEFDSQIEIGRQKSQVEEPYSKVGTRVVVAEIDKSEISRTHITAEVAKNQRIRIQNKSSINAVRYGKSDWIAPDSSQELFLPAVLTIGDRVLEFESLSGDTDSNNKLDSFAHSPAAPGKNSPKVDSSIHEMLLGRSESETNFLLKGLHHASSAFRHADSADEFYESACAGVVDFAALDCAAVILWQDNKWNIKCFRSRTGDSEPLGDWNPSYSVLNNVLKNKRTFWQIPSMSSSDAPSLMDVKALVAAPMLDESGQVIGALYGDRRQLTGGTLNKGLTEVEAILVEVMASGMASGIQRMNYQKEAAEARVLFEQFFTPELSRELENSPDLLVGKDVEVSLLFCEIRGFSEFSEQLGTRLTLDWINDVMGTLSSCITASDGTLVDMMGDEIIGMWGAPKECKEHANLACTAAVRMFEELPGLNRRWQKSLDKPMDIGIGIHTGIARVGNIGSQRKFKYGPLGTTVRVAMQAQRSARKFGAKILITSETKDQLSDTFSIRQLGRLIDKQSDSKFHMFEIVPTPPADWDQLKRRYETAVSAYLKKDYPTAISLIGKILAEHPGDRPSLQLMSRINKQITPKPWTL